MVSLDDVKKIDQEFTEANIKHHILVLEHAKHGFTNPKADDRARKTGVDVGYNENAERKSIHVLFDALKKEFN